MPRMYSHQYLIYNLAGNFYERERQYMPQEVAYQLLKQVTGQDFGYDHIKWESWIEEQIAEGSNVGTKCYCMVALEKGTTGKT